MSTAFVNEKKGEDSYIQDSVSIGQEEGKGGHIRDAHRPVKGFVVLVAIMAAFGGLMFGYDVGGSGGTLVMPSFREHFDWPPADCCSPGEESSGVDYCMRFGCDKDYTDCLAVGTVYEGRVLTECEDDSWTYNTGSVSDSQGWISTCFTLGCFAGALTASWQCDKLGRKRTLMIHDCVFLVGAAMQMAAPGIAVMYIGRIIGGIGVGTLSMVVPLYQSEMAPEHIRGKLVSLQQLCITAGIVTAAGANIGLKHWKDGWRISYGGNTIFAIIMFFAMLVLPDSPRWLLVQGRVNEAREVLMKVRYPDEIEEEIQTVTQQIELEREIGSGTWAQVFGTENNMRYRTFLGAALQFFQQWTGINAIMFFAPDILNTFFSEDASLYGNLILMFFNFISTFICIYLIDKTGRIALLLIGGFGMIIGLLGCCILSSPALDYKNDQTVGIFIVVFCVIYVGCFAFSWGPIIWVVCSELYPQNLRSKCMSISTASNWAMAAVVGKCTPYMYKDDAMNLWGTFLYFLVFVVVMLFYMYYSLPETIGVVLEDTDQLFAEFKPGFHRKLTSVNHIKTYFN